MDSIALSRQPQLAVRPVTEPSARGGRGKVTTMKWYFHACPSCGGDLYEDPEERGWVTCLMCARSFRAIQALPAARLDGAQSAAAASEPHLGNGVAADGRRAVPAPDAQRTTRRPAAGPRPKPMDRHQAPTPPQGAPRNDFAAAMSAESAERLIRREATSRHVA